MDRRFKGGFLGSLRVLALLLSACGGGGGGGGGGSGGDADAALLAELEKIFPFTPNQPFDVIYQCQRPGSTLTYTLNFKNDQTFDIYTTTSSTWRRIRHPSFSSISTRRPPRSRPRSGYWPRFKLRI